MNERNALKTITLLLDGELKILTRMFDSKDMPSLAKTQIDNLNNAVEYITQKTVELNEREYPNEMAEQPETPIVSNN
jgi:hypothetical protein